MIKHFAYQRLIIFGPPGVGKGTLAKAIVKHFAWEHLSTGDIFREQIAKQTKLGLELQKIIAQGVYVPDQLTNTIAYQAIAKCEKAKQAYLLDGYPRTLGQSEFLFSKVKAQNFLVLGLKAPHAIILKRLSGRRHCPLCKRQYHIEYKKPLVTNLCDFDQSELQLRVDDKPSAILKRVAVFEQETAQLKAEFSQKALFYELDASQDAKSVFHNFLKLLKSLENKKADF